MRAAVFLDRDGVINIDKHYVHRREDFQFANGVFAALRSIAAHGYCIVIVTNQSAIGRGYCSEEDFRQLRRWMLAKLAAHGVEVTAVYHCPHAPDDGCLCRKPAPGMILRAARELGLDLARSWLIGDRETDMEAALRAGVGHTALLRNGHGTEPVATTASYVCRGLKEMVPLLAKPCPGGKAIAQRPA